MNYASKKKMSVEEVIRMYEEKRIPKRHNYYIELNGEKVSIKEYCRIKGINYSSVVNYRARTKKKYEEILKLYEEKPKRRKDYDIGGKSLKEYCKENNIEEKYQCILNYKDRHKVSIEEAIARYK